MKKILFLNSTLNIGGAEKMLYETVKHLDSSMFTKKVCCLYGPGKIGEALISEGEDLSHSLMKNKYDLRVIYRLSRMIRLEKPDILCVESSPLALFWGFLCAKFSKVPCVVTFIHNMRKPGFFSRAKTDMIYRLILPGLQGIGVVSQARIDSMVKEYGLDRAKLSLIRNSVDISKFSKNKNTDGLKKTLGISKNEKIIGMVGRLVNEKAYDVFLKAAGEIARVMPETRFLIIGEGRERQSLESSAKTLGIKDKVLFLGERNDVPELINLFDVSVLSSRMESFPVTLLEYMACSRPIVATMVGGNSEIIQNGKTGILVPLENYIALAKAITKLLLDEDSARKMAKSARESVEDNFSINRMMEKMQRFFIEASGAPLKNQVHVIMTGPSLEVKGGISGFAKYYIKEDFSEKFRIIYHSTTVDGNKIKKLFFYIKSVFIFILKLISDRKIKIVHICSSSEGSFYRKAVILFLSKAFGKKAIFHIHGSRFYNKAHFLRRFCVKKALDISDSVLVLSKEWVIALKRMTNNKNIKMIPNAVDTSCFKITVAGKESHGLNILAVSKLTKQKGTYDILDIVPLVVKEMPEVKFYFAGNGELEKVKALCKARGIENNVVLLGWLDRDRLVEVFKDASIFILPSYQECFPVSILEAMAAGLPVISTRVGGIPEMIEDGRNGFLVEPGKTQELYKRIMELLKDNNLRDSMAKNNIEKAESMFGLARVRGMFISEYENIMFRDNKSQNRFMWYLKRLSCMSLPEVIYRSYKAIKAKFGRLRPKDIDPGKILKEETLAGKFYFDRFDAEEFKKLFPGLKEGIIADAELIRGHNFKIFSLNWSPGEKIDWHKDIITQKTWPLKHWASIDFRNGHDSKEARFTWELNRQQYLLPLGKAYAITKDIKYSLEIKQQIFSWIEANPPYYGINWASALELSLRLISWCWAYKFIEASGIFSKDEKKEFLRSVYLQADFIINNLSRYSSANNHLIGEAAGLIITALTFPEFKSSEKWLNKGRRILFQEMLKQVSPDGVSKEQAFHYQAFIMELFILAGVLLKKNDIEIPVDVLDRFFKMSEFIMNIVNKNGKIAEFGDSDNGKAIRLSSESGFNLNTFLLTGASIFSGREDFKAKGRGFKEGHYWIFGIDGFEKYNSIKSVNPGLSSRLFKEGGYCILRNPSNDCKEEIFMMDCGELGYPFMAPHGHADLLSITLSVDGVDLLIDPGTYLYHTAGAWRDYFRSTRAHNTITINDRNQSEIKGPFMWGKRPAASVDGYEFSDQKDCITASCDNPGISHKREIYFYKKQALWMVQDSVAAIGKNIIRQYFHLGQDSAIEKLAANIIEAENHGVFLYMLLDKRFSVEIKKGEVAPILGWSSDIFGKKIENYVLVNTASIENRGEFNTVLYVSREKISLEKAQDKLNEAGMK